LDTSPLTSSREGPHGELEGHKENGRAILRVIYFFFPTRPGLPSASQHGCRVARKGREGLVFPHFCSTIDQRTTLTLLPA